MWLLGKARLPVGLANRIEAQPGDDACLNEDTADWSQYKTIQYSFNKSWQKATQDKSW